MRYRAYRYPCGKPVTLWFRGTCRPGQGINVSVCGARIASRTPLTPGDRVAIDADPGHLPRQALVRWVRRGYARVRFQQPSAPRELAVIRETGVCDAPDIRRIITEPSTSDKTPPGSRVR